MKLAFWGNFGTQNLGNECTLHAVLESSRRFLPDAEFVSICNDPRDTVERHHIEALPIARHETPALDRVPRPLRQVLHLVAEPKDWWRAVRAMRTVDMLVVPGTGILTDTHAGMLGIPYQLFKWAAAARLCGRKVAFVSVGAEKLTDPKKTRFIAWALRLASYRSYRDGVSRGRAAGLTDLASEDPIYPDLAFSLPKPLLENGEARRPGEKSIVVGIYSVESGPEGMEAYVDALGQFVVWLLERGYRTRIVIGDTEYDETARQKLRAWLERKQLLDRVIDEPAESFEKLLTQLAEADLVVATRFHNVLLSLLLGKPVLSVSHMDKNDELMSAMGLTAYCMPIAELRPDDLVKRFLELEQNAANIRTAIAQKLELFRGQLEEQYAQLFAQHSRQG